jgi:AcrR family transcriptional regulator
MPRLAAKDSEKIQLRIESAALKRLIKSGYNGVVMRDIAKEAKVPLGSLYNYFEDKEALFKHLVAQETQHFLRLESPLVQYLLTSDFPNDLERFAKSVSLSVEESASYFKLMYIDVVEFDGKHFKNAFSNLDKKFKDVLKLRFKEIGLLGSSADIDPSFVFITIYLNFYQYFILSKLFGATDIYGPLSDQKVVTKMIQLFKSGFQRKS